MVQAIIWSKSFCPYCVQAKSLMEKYHIDYAEKNISKGADMNELLAQVPSARTMPQIWIDGKYLKNGKNGELTYVGPYHELVKQFNKDYK